MSEQEQIYEAFNERPKLQLSMQYLRMLDNILDSLDGEELQHCSTVILRVLTHYSYTQELAVPVSTLEAMPLFIQILLQEMLGEIDRQKRGYTKKPDTENVPKKPRGGQKGNQNARKKNE